jgi:hypothetical protein
MCKDLLRLEPVTSENNAEPVPLEDAAVIQMSLSFMRVCKNFHIPTDVHLPCLKILLFSQNIPFFIVYKSL